MPADSDDDLAVDVTIRFLAALQDTSLDHATWLDGLEDLARSDLYADLARPGVDASDFTYGQATELEVVAFENTGIITTVYALTPSGQLQVTLWRDSATSAWRVAWWERVQ